MNIHSAYATLLRKEDLTTPVRAVIDSVMVQDVGTEQKPDMKPVVHFRGTLKPAKLNKTNSQILAEAWGAETEKWIGRTVELFIDPTVEYPKGKRVGGIGFRIPGHDSGIGFSFWSKEQAIAEAAKVGLTWTDIVLHLRNAGMSGFRPDRDTALIKSLIASKSVAEEPFDAPPPPMDGDEVPF